MSNSFLLSYKKMNKNVHIGNANVSSTKLKQVHSKDRSATQGKMEKKVSSNMMFLLTQKW